MIDLIALGLVAGAAFLGWRRGTILTLLAGTGLVAGYLGALFFYRPIGDLIDRSSSVGPLVAYPLGGLAAMVAVGLPVSVLTRIVRMRRNRRLREGFHASPLDSMGGAVVGGLWGVGVVVVLSWGATILEGVSDLDLGVERSMAGRRSADLVAGVAEFLAGGFLGNDALAGTLAVFAVRPAEALASLNSLTSDPRIGALLNDQGIRRAIESGDIETLTHHPVVAQLLREPDFLRAARNLELIEGLGSDSDSRQIASQLAERLGPLLSAMENMSRDPEVQRILSESRPGEALDVGNLREFLSRGDFNELVRRLVDELRMHRSD